MGPVNIYILFDKSVNIKNLRALIFYFLAIQPLYFWTMFTHKHLYVVFNLKHCLLNEARMKPTTWSETKVFIVDLFVMRSPWTNRIEPSCTETKRS